MKSKASLRERLAFSLTRLAEAPADAAAAAPALETRQARFLLFDPSFAPLIRRIDQALPQTAANDVPALLAPLPLDVFALLAAHRPVEYPNLSAWLPAMPPAEVQVGFTGSAGETVMLEAAAFVGALAHHARARGVDLARARVLDYGVGWGRVSRLLYRFTPAPRVYGVDAWPGSLSVARQLGLHGPLELIAELPERLPFAERFDVVCAFSVFTHLGEGAMRAALRAIRASLDPGGLLAVTVRPMDIWRLQGADAALAHRHQEHGFAFQGAGDSEIYGDASMTLDYIRREWRGFDIARVEVNALDPYQVMVILTAA